MAYQHLIKRVKNDIDTIRSVLNTNKYIRDLISDSKSQQNMDRQIIDHLKEKLPKNLDWSIYEHCSVVTKLYAIYESLVENLISDWLTILPTLYAYKDLPDKIKNTHREGVGRLLREINKNRYKELKSNPTKVINGLYAGINNLEQYDLIAEAFLYHEQNLRLNILEKLLGDVDFTDIKQWISHHRKIKSFRENIRATMVESELNKLIDYRNDAAHGSIIKDPLDLNSLGFDELMELCNFIESVCIALVELFEYKTIKCQENFGKAKNVGQITEWFKKAQAGVAKIENVKLSIEDNIILLRETYCQSAIIKSLKDNNKSVHQIETITEREVGVKFDVNARKGLLLYVIE